MAHTVIPPPRGTTATLELTHKGNINDKTIPERDREVRDFDVTLLAQQLRGTINSQRFRLLPQKYDILLIFYSLSRSRTSWEAGFHTWVDVYL